MVSHYIAEFHNTWSNALFVLVGLHGLWFSTRQGYEKRFHAVYFGVIVIGLGSAAFHATLLKVAQQCDETPMIWSCLCWLYLLYEPEWAETDALLAAPREGLDAKLAALHSAAGGGGRLHRLLHALTAPADRAERWLRQRQLRGGGAACCTPSRRTAALWLYGICFAALHAAFEPTLLFFAQFFLLIAYCMRKIVVLRASCVDELANLLAARYPRTVIVAFACWNLDMHFCQSMRALPINPQGHAWWHLLMALSVFWGMQFMHFVRAAQLGWRPVVRRGLFGLPLVHVDRKASALSPEEKRLQAEGRCRASGVRHGCGPIASPPASPPAPPRIKAK